MKITRKQLRKLIMEYEQYVDEDGNVYDDEGNVSRRGKAFGRRYGGGTYGLRGLPSGGGRSRRKTSYVGADANADQIAAVEAALSAKPNKFLQSILDQLKKGRGLSSKQKGIVKKILMKTDAEAASLFEGLVLEGNHAVDYAHGYEDARDGLPQNSDNPWYAAGFADYFEGIHDQYEALHQDGITNPPAEAGPMMSEGKDGDMHRCMDGSMVPSQSHECLADIMNRIDDTQYHRDHHTCGTENRVYYNGLLKNLRGKRNRLQKTLPPLELDLEV